MVGSGRTGLEVVAEYILCCLISDVLAWLQRFLKTSRDSGVCLVFGSSKEEHGGSPLYRARALPAPVNR